MIDTTRYRELKRKREVDGSLSKEEEDEIISLEDGELIRLSKELASAGYTVTLPDEKTIQSFGDIVQELIDLWHQLLEKDERSKNDY